MSNFADTFATGGAGDRFDLGAHWGHVLLVVPVGYLADRPSKYPNPDKGGQLLNDVSVVDVLPLFGPPNSDSVGTWSEGVWFGSKHARGVTSRECQNAQGGRPARPMLKLVDGQPMKNDPTRQTYGLVELDPTSQDVIRMVPGFRDMTVTQVEQAAAELVAKLQGDAMKAYREYLDGQKVAKQQAANEMFTQAPAQQFEQRPHVTDDPWA